MNTTAPLALSTLLSALSLSLAGCATPVQTPGGEVICYSSQCVQEMRAWTRQDYQQRQYEQDAPRRATARTPAPPVKRPAPAPPPPQRQRPAGQIPCPADMIPSGPPEYGCVYPRP
jgi:hypothetical protein